MPAKQLVVLARLDPNSIEPVAIIVHITEPTVHVVDSSGHEFTIPASQVIAFADPKETRRYWRRRLAAASAADARRRHDQN